MSIVMKLHQKRNAFQNNPIRNRMNEWMWWVAKNGRLWDFYVCFIGGLLKKWANLDSNA